MPYGQPLVPESNASIVNIESAVAEPFLQFVDPEAFRRRVKNAPTKAGPARRVALLRVALRDEMRLAGSAEDGEEFDDLDLDDEDGEELDS